MIGSRDQRIKGGCRVVDLAKMGQDSNNGTVEYRVYNSAVSLLGI